MMVFRLKIVLIDSLLIILSPELSFELSLRVLNLLNENRGNLLWVSYGVLFIAVVPVVVGRPVRAMSIESFGFYSWKSRVLRIV